MSDSVVFVLELPNLQNNTFCVRSDIAFWRHFWHAGKGVCIKTSLC